MDEKFVQQLLIEFRILWKLFPFFIRISRRSLLKNFVVYYRYVPCPVNIDSTTKIYKNCFFSGVVHEHPRIGSDGESEEGSRTSEDVVSPANRGGLPVDSAMATSASSTASSASAASNNVNGTTMYGGVKMRQKANNPRRLTSQEEINKRLSLPADLKLPDNFVEKQAVSPTLEGPLTRATRRQSLSEIGFGRMDTYTKLDKLGEVSWRQYLLRFSGRIGVTNGIDDENQFLFRSQGAFEIFWICFSSENPICSIKILAFLRRAPWQHSA